jgi:hypothetical protein
MNRHADKGRQSSDCQRSVGVGSQLHEDGPPNIEARGWEETGVIPEYVEAYRKLGEQVAKCIPLAFPGGIIDAGSWVHSHNGPTPTTIRNTKRTRPAEQYPGEAERMIDTWTLNAMAAIQRARDATTGPRLVSELEEAQHAIGEAIRWSKP